MKKSEIKRLQDRIKKNVISDIHVGSMDPRIVTQDGIEFMVSADGPLEVLAENVDGDKQARFRILVAVEHIED